MHAGRLRHRVHIELASKTADSAGTLVETWAPVVMNVPAEIAPLRGQEFVLQHQNQATVTHKIVIRYFDGLTSKHRIRWGTRVFNLAGPPINVGERNRTHELMATEAE